MNKQNTIIIVLLISTAFVRAGIPVTCGNGHNCDSCGDTADIRANFIPITWTQCMYTQCNTAPSSISSFVCQSCFGQPNSITALNKGNYYDPSTTSCVNSCPLGTQADSSNTCKPNPKPGNNISCGSSGSCSGCGATTQIANLFTPVPGPICQVTDCSQIPSSYNSYVCQSCYQAAGAIAALNIGNYYDLGTSACVASCPIGTKADNTNTCQIVKPGNNVSCGSSGSCSGCGATPQIANLFTPVTGLICKMNDCSQKPSSYNSYVCQSCYQAAGAIAALNIGNYYDLGTSACVASCPIGTKADNTNTCQIVKPGNNVSCGSSGSCSGCGATPQIANLFTPVTGLICKMNDCSQTPSSYNSYVCQSCYQAPGAIAALNIGNYYNPGTHACVTSCPQGTQADNTNTCQPIPTKPGNNISCGSSGSCSGCGTTPEIVNLFTPVSGSSCKVTDCSQTPTSYNSYVCQSCYQLTGAIAALNIGNYYDPGTNACVAECPKGKVADINKTCQTPKTIIGKDVGCGTAASNGNAANCNLCGDNSTMQNLFSYDTTTAGQNCQFKDCSTIPSTLNGWICNSCNGVEGSKIPVGLYFNGSTCVSTCSTGVATSQTNWTCKIFNTYNFGSFLSLVIYFLLLNILF
ncbi:immobilization antigen (macronuclear) [Tetrahymena thermophila SB210]|uniref:Immobilization antigen n=1 Tax=Tetrahymena thermophila (strain SB210) TaxID=312017 RepID=Q23J47_TETTS|nr:immobilization antigen [Tetrahymena thermophila SB210]EAR96657.1 immobilization antigen [Tetrahymena thermophila SB210]|eukprot:XP_001016902.1 immobilization antigen [Tetrahymena thermophila SB210]